MRGTVHRIDFSFSGIFNWKMALIFPIVQEHVFSLILLRLKFSWSLLASIDRKSGNEHFLLSLSWYRRLLSLSSTPKTYLDNKSHLHSLRVEEVHILPATTNQTDAVDWRKIRKLPCLLEFFRGTFACQRRMGWKIQASKLVLLHWWNAMVEIPMAHPIDQGSYAQQKQAERHEHQPVFCIHSALHH